MTRRVRVVLSAAMIPIASCASPVRRVTLVEKLQQVETVTPTTLRSPADLFSAIAPAVVKIIVYGERAGFVASGSGLVLYAPSSTICHVVTNHHVIRAARVINVEFHDGSIAWVSDVLSEDPSLDLAILRVELVNPREPVGQTTLDIQYGDQPPVGTRLYAIGSPMGMKNTLSDGLLSGYRSQDSQVTWVQITNPISPGSSGGPVFTDTGVFVGITTASLPDAQNLNFAIPAKKVQEFVARQKAPRPIWKGSCIVCEEQAGLFPMYDELYERFSRLRPDLQRRKDLKLSDMGMWWLGLVYNSRSEQFLEFCTAEAIDGNRDAMVLMGFFHLGAARVTNPDRFTRSNEAATLLKQALAFGGDDTFIILLAIGKANISLLGALETARALPEGSRERFLDDTIRTLETARDLRPTFAPTLFELSEAMIRRGRLREALQVSAQLVRLVPNSPDAHGQRAEVLLLLGSKLAAIDELRVVCALDPYDEFAAMELGGLYMETGQHEKAIDAFRYGLDARSRRIAAPPHNTEDSPELGAASAEIDKPISRGTLTWQLHCAIARSLVALRRYDEAVDAYRLALGSAGDGAGPENRLMLERELAACRAALRGP